MDEIWTVTNARPNLPMSVQHRVLERIDPFTGKENGRWPWKMMKGETMSHTYRYMLAAGYAHGEPVLITAQGTYGDMYLQGWNTGMTSRWDIEIGKDEPGARSSHIFPVLDFNEDGVDELFWGERVLSVDDGSEVFCCDKHGFAGHSDILVPFVDPQSGKKFIYTARENYEMPGVKRVVLFDEKGDTVWSDLDMGHMHRAWIASVGENRRYVAMAMSLAVGASGSDVHRSTPTTYYYDALTGEPVDFKFPHPGQNVIPLDINGDGYHEFIGTAGEAMGKVFDRFGNVIADAGGMLFRTGKIEKMNGMQFMTYYKDEGKVRVWGDDEAGSEVTAPNAERYHEFMQHLMASGYHRNCLIDCGM